jgi:hypothetical protein
VPKQLAEQYVMDRHGEADAAVEKIMVRDARAPR